jgi:hypothetical protein
MQWIARFRAARMRAASVQAAERAIDAGYWIDAQSLFYKNDRAVSDRGTESDIRWRERLSA